MRFVYVMWCAMFCVSVACANPVVLKVGKSVEFSAGVYSFNAAPISFGGRRLGYASVDFIPQQFSERYWAYLSCVITRNNPDTDGECAQWKMLDTRTGSTMNLYLPGFDGFWSTPSFAWPFIAYTEVEKNSVADRRAIYCVVFDFRDRRVVRREQRRIDDSIFGTDFPHMFYAPTARKLSDRYFFTFEFDNVGKINKLCELTVG